MQFEPFELAMVLVAVGMSSFITGFVVSYWISNRPGKLTPEQKSQIKFEKTVHAIRSLVLTPEDMKKRRKKRGL